ncbi:MAG TPA: PAS domain-containing protein [Gemmatimonadaceae bacterium]|nr:PAS domain-containing protein [Gemmatimonadaceae bacterium]
MTPLADSPRRSGPTPAVSDAGANAALAEILFHSTVAGVVIIDRDLRYVRINETMAAMNGRPAAAHIGQSIHDVVPDAAAELEPVLRYVMDSGEPLVDVPVTVEHPAGVQRRLIMSYYPMRDASGVVTGIANVTIEQSADRDSERNAIYVAAREADRARVLRRVMTRLSEATAIPQVASAVLEDALSALGADAGFLGYILYDAEGRPTAYEAVRMAGYDDVTTARYSRAPITPGRPIAEVSLTGAGSFVENLEECRARYPAVIEEFTRFGFRSFAALPAKVGDRVVAVLTFSFREDRHFDSATRDFLGTLAEQCALALERVRLHEEGLRAAERQAAILVTVQDAFIAFDHELRLTYVNARALEMMRREADTVLGRRYVDLFPDGVGKPLHQAMERLLETGTAQEVAAYSPMLGSWVQARLYPAPDGLSMVAQDISVQRRRQQASAFLAEASGHLAASLDYQQTIRIVASAAVPTLGDWCVVTLVEDPESHEWPPRLERVAVVAQDPEMLELAQSLTDRYPIDLSPASGMYSVLRTAKPVLVPAITDEMLKRLAQDAEHLELLRALKLSSLIIVPLIARGVTLGALTLCMTASERRYDADDLALAQDLAHRQALAVDNARLFAAAQRARSDAEAANRAKTEFLAVMSYELRTPLSAIGGYVRILDMELHGPVTEQQRTALERIRRSEVHLAEIINQVLDFAKLESGTVSYDLRPLKLGEVVADIVPRVELQRAAKRLGLQVRMPSQPTSRDARVLADGDKLQQVLINLLSNAVKFTPPGGQVMVELLPEADEHGMTGLRVTDTGIGIPQSKLEAIFEPFVQVDRSLNKPGEGTGLGLAISRVLARGMGGDLTASSKVGVGTTFTLRLPHA